MGQLDNFNWDADKKILPSNGRKIVKAFEEWEQDFYDLFDYWPTESQLDNWVHNEGGRIAEDVQDEDEFGIMEDVDDIIRAGDEAMRKQGLHTTGKSQPKETRPYSAATQPKESKPKVAWEQVEFNKPSKQKEETPRPSSVRGLGFKIKPL
jgi:hypothetical protein